MSGGHSSRNKRGGGAARSRHGPPRQTNGRNGNNGSSSRNVVSIPATPSSANGAPPPAEDRAASPGVNGSVNNGTSNGASNGQKSGQTRPDGAAPSYAGKAGAAPTAPLIVRPPQPTQAAQSQRTAQAAQSVPTTHRLAPHQAPREQQGGSETTPETSAPSEPFVVEPLQSEEQHETQGKRQAPNAPAGPRPRFERFYAPGQNRNNHRSTASSPNGQPAHSAANDHASQGDVAPSANSALDAHSDRREIVPPLQRNGANGIGSSTGLMGGDTGANGLNGHSQAMAPMSAERPEDDESDEIVIAPPPRGEVGKLIDALHAIFEQDRAISSQGSNQRCGICYLHYPASELEYREGEGFYVCPLCRRSLGNTRLTMVRRQQK